jgi:integrase/recombinase XerC
MTRVALPGMALQVLPSSVALLQPEESAFEAMLTGWAAQQTARMLAPGTIESREAVIRRFMVFTGEYPWKWQPADVEDWTVHLRTGGQPPAHSTVCNYHNAIAMFCDYLVDARYAWAERCLELFGTHPVQICHEWNTARHISAQEGRAAVRPFTRQELQTFFDFADEQMDRARRLHRKGWAASFRDATLFKTIYAFGLRRREAVMLDLADFLPNPKHRRAVCSGSAPCDTARR